MMTKAKSDRRLGVRRIGHCVVAELRGASPSTALMTRLSDEMEDLCSEIRRSDEIRTLIVSYGGNTFRAATTDLVLESDADGAAVTALVSQLEIPVIAAIDGDATGLGLELALACDIRIGVKGAMYGLPQLLEGAMPFAGGTQRLPRLVGRGKALEMILTGQPIDADEAYRIGLIQRLVPPDELMASALKLASEMESASPLATKYVKEALYSGIDLTLDQGMRMELDLYLLLFTTSDRVEGITAFQQKRMPSFEGR